MKIFNVDNFKFLFLLVEIKKKIIYKTYGNTKSK